MTLGETITNEEKKLEEDKNKTKYWKRWGPYLGERQWATVREDYSDNGDAWSAFPFEHSRSRVYRWGEDGLAGVSDNHQLICLSLGLWNEKDDILKEKAFGLTNSQGNHGEDVKELYYYLDNTPTHSYMKYLYKYPTKKYPYKELIDQNANRSRQELEFEITDIKDLFKENNYFDILFEMAKSNDDPDELYFRITATNKSNEPAPLHIIPNILFRNTWSWDSNDPTETERPKFSKEFNDSNYSIKIDHYKLGNRRLIFAPAPGVTENSPDIEPKLLFTENESNLKRLYDVENKFKYVKDGFHDYIIDEVEDAVNPENFGTKACGWFQFDEIPPNENVTIRYKLTPIKDSTEEENSEIEIDEEEFDLVFEQRSNDADEFYWNVSPLPIPDELRNVQRQAFAGLLWTKQFYNFVHDAWYHGDTNADISPTPNRAGGRNKEWKHLYIEDILSLPDKWEYPFFAAWDSAFHCIPLSMIDPTFAKKQLDLLTREWYMHPNGQIPAYEWNFSDVNPPVHAWSAFRIYKLEKKFYKKADREFLERVFQKLLLNFTWWVNIKDSDGNGVFEGGFLGLDNIGIFNRSEPLPTGGSLEQTDATGWMAFFSLQMLNIALELAKENPVYEDIASKFFEHYLLIADAMSFQSARVNEDRKGKTTNESLWSETDQFFYDAITWGDNHKQKLPVRSLVGLIPLYASLTLEPEILKRFPNFRKRLEWLVENKKYLIERNIGSMNVKGSGDRLLLSLVSKERLLAILSKMFDENEFLSNYGIRSLSKFHESNPFTMNVNGENFEVGYLPGESNSGLFGGNSNWRGPIWLPVNFLLIESLQKFYLYYGPEVKIEVPTNSGNFINLAQAANEVQHRLIHLFLPDEEGKRACNGEDDVLNNNEAFKELVPFYEYFHGDTGRGLGASHQCGWTALVAKWIHDVGVSCRPPSTPTASLKRRNSYFNFEDESVTKNYIPISSPFKNLIRRKSGKSLLNLTTAALDLSIEEQQTVLKEIPGISRRNSMKTINSDTSSIEQSEDFLRQVQSAMSKFQLKDDDEVSSDEFEAKY
ncbi:hypothetical protein B5S28_g3420 [[Candida] boidinii]|nr:hypothetical protein B5S28_g3420 [[Candida] boidinii]OWB64258.1 hypothetical protein B5S29_g5318 [[Candida] boidinii]